MNIEELIKNFLEVIAKPSDTPVEVDTLNKYLDLLACSIHECKFEFDNSEYPDPPEKKYTEVRKIIEANFPTLGFYNSVKESSKNIADSEILVGDAIDDIADIVGDLQETLWHFQNTSASNALWYFNFSFKSHWGSHLRELQLYLHRLHSE